MTRWSCTCVLVLAAAVHGLAAQTFRAAAHAVAVEVAVFDGDHVVPSLTAADFDVRDNGVRQKVAEVDFNTLPLDLRLVFDVSGSIADDQLEWYARAMRQVAATLEPRDRGEIITFNARIADLASRQHPPVAINLDRSGLEGTSFFDAVSMALVTVPLLDRRQVTIVLSDARDNASFFDEVTMLDIAQRTDAVVYTVLPGDAVSARALSISRLRAIAMLTGGRLVHAPHDAAVGDAIITALNEFRQSYVLRYTPAGVPLEGWHRLEVKVRDRNYRIRAKAGYFGR
jgi:hypothetical protein